MPDADTQPVRSPSPRGSSSAVRQPPAPSYLSARSADVILSEVRPTRIKSEALRSVNVLLDELLWLILGCARSFAPDRLRMGLLKVLPTALGKDALLEAEVELRAYIERNPPATPLPTDEPTIQKFPLQQAFELLRIKCEAYSSLGDQEENTDTEVSLHARMVQIAGDATPKLAAVAPAALYLTAILEHVCEHVLSNVGRVVARDSSRATAHAQDLYVALCEDETIYSLFKTMKVQEQIEQQSKMARPRRSKSFSRNELGAEISTLADTPAVPKSRPSLDSAMSNGSNSNLTQPNRSSVDKGRGKVSFKNPRTTAEAGNSNSGDPKHRRSSSLLGDKKSSTSEDAVKPDSNVELSPTTDDDGSMQDFDDLMRSGTTMKVSLTPDRLKTFEVFAKEKNQRANRPALPPSSSVREANHPPSSFPNGASHLLNKTRTQVEPIAEAPEGDPTRSRSASIASPSAPKVENPITSRSRSFTDSRGPSGRPDLFAPLSNKDTDATLSAKPAMPVPVSDSSTGNFKQHTRRQLARHRESIDLDDLLDGSEDEPVARKVLLTPKSAQTATNGTRELIDFLSEGPPEPPPIVTTPSGAPFSDSRGTKQGRFRTIVSRLTGGVSTEKLSSRSADDSLDTISRSATLGVNGNSGPLRPSNPLHSKRSAPNVAAAARPIPPPMSSPSSDNNTSASGLRTRQLSLNRKAVPAWDTSKRTTDPPVYPKSPTKQVDVTGSTKPLPQPSASPTIKPPVDDNNTDAVSPTRKRPPYGFDQPPSSDSAGDVKLSPPGFSPSPSTNGHANVDGEPVKAPLRTPLKSDRRVPPLTLSISTDDERVRDLRRLMARATSAPECRVLVDMFLAKCGALPKDQEQEQVSGPITPPISPVRVEVDSRHEANLIEVLLGDSGTSSPQGLVVNTGTSTNHTRPRSLEPAEVHDRASPILPPALSPAVTTA